MISRLRPNLVSSNMMCFETSVSSGMSCRACRNEADARANSRSIFNRAPCAIVRSCSSGVGVLEASSGGICAAFFSFGRVGKPSDSMIPLKRASVCTPKASRIEPATILSLLLSMVEKATSMTKKLIIKPIRSAKVTNQPCPPPCAAPRCFFAIPCFLELRHPPLGRYRFALFLTVFFRQVSQQHFPHESRAFGVSDHQDAVDDQRAIGLFVEQLAVKLVG